MNARLAAGLLLSALLGFSCVTAPPLEKRSVRVGVIGGMIKSGLWPALARQFETNQGWPVEVVVSGNRDVLAGAFRAGEADLIVVHASELSSNLVSEGFAKEGRVWTRNEYVLVGPRADPAHVRGLRDGGEALRRIAAAAAPFVDFQNSGTRDINSRLWRKAGLQPEGPWLLPTDSDSSEEVMEFARQHQAYLVIGRIPMRQGIFSTDGLEILVQGDPDLHRPFVVLEASAKKFPTANIRGARALAEFLLAPATQSFLQNFGTNSPGGMPLFHPVSPP